MLNDQSFVEDIKRTGSPEEPKEDKRRFKKMPDTSQDKQEVIDKCLNGGYGRFESLMGDHPGIHFMVQLQTGLPNYGDKRPGLYTGDQADDCVTFVRLMNKMLEKRVDAMDLGDINDLFLGES